MGKPQLILTMEEAVWLLTPICQLLVVASIFRCKLARIFPVFIGFLIFDVARSSVLWWLGESPFTDAYRKIWVASEPVFLLIQFLVVLELYRLLYKAYPGIHGFARGLIAMGAVIALVLTFGTVRVDLGSVAWSAPDLQRLFFVKRVVCSLLGVVTLTTMAFFPRARSARNILFHGWLLTAFLTIAAIGFFAIDIGTDTETIGLLFLVFQMTCFVWWGVGFRKQEPPRNRPSEEETRRVNKLNTDLLAVAKWLAR